MAMLEVTKRQHFNDLSGNGPKAVATIDNRVSVDRDYGVLITPPVLSEKG